VLIFVPKSGDIADPVSSPLCPDLRTLPAVAALAERLDRATRVPYDQVPTLEQFILMCARNLVSHSHRDPFSYRDSPYQTEQRKRAVSHADHDRLRTTRDFVAEYPVFRRSSKHEHRLCPDAVDGVHRDDPRSNKAPEHVAGIREDSAAWLALRPAPSISIT
jgi:hypothetical protein